MTMAFDSHLAVGLCYDSLSCFIVTSIAASGSRLRFEVIVGVRY